jgi:hypothetical protein
MEIDGVEGANLLAMVVATKKVLRQNSPKKCKGDSDTDEAEPEVPVEMQPDAKRKWSLPKIPKTNKTPATPATDRTLKILEDHLVVDNSWEVFAIFAGHKEPVRGDMANSPILLMQFLSGPKHGQKFERYDFWDIDSVVAFWLEQCHILIECVSRCARSVLNQAVSGCSGEAQL